jgi:hypothetical protein
MLAPWRESELAAEYQAAAALAPARFNETDYSTPSIRWYCVD